MTPISNLTMDKVLRSRTGGNVRKSGTGRAKRIPTFPTLLAVGFLVAVMALAHPQPVSACGWWGDGESDDTEVIEIGPDGQPVMMGSPVWNTGDDQDPAPAASGGLEVPAPRSGYGIVVHQDGSAVPYLNAVPGQRAYSIQQLHSAGFPTVIDLGTPPMVAALHRRETEALGMKYFNIPVDGDAPEQAHVARFNEILSTEENLPVLVFSASANLLGKIWARHRLTAGLPRDKAISEGRGLGFSEEAETLGE